MTEQIDALEIDGKTVVVGTAITLHPRAGKTKGRRVTVHSLEVDRHGPLIGYCLEYAKVHYTRPEAIRLVHQPRKTRRGKSAT